MPGKLTIRSAITVLSMIVLAIAIVYLFKRSIFERSADIDFRFIWTAGRLWALGIDPYSSRFTSLGHDFFPTGNDIAYWLYPPQWWVIARALAAVPAERALIIWRGINAALLVAGAAALALVVRHARPATPSWAILLAVALITLMEGAAQTLLLGQTSMLVFAGFCLMAIALVTSARWPMVAGLVLLLLKPQFAVPILICLVMAKPWRSSVLAAVAITILASLPQLLQHGVLPTVTGLLGNMARHGQLSSNRPENLIGFSHLVWLVTGANMANVWDIALDLIASVALALAVYRRAAPDRADQATLAIALIASAMFFLPLHAYDTVALGPVALLAMMIGGVPRYLALAAVLLALRPGIISAQFGSRDSGDLLLLSLAALLALAAAVIALVRRRDDAPEVTASASASVGI